MPVSVLSTRIILRNLDYIPTISFMDAGRRHRTPWSETKDFIARSKSGTNISIHYSSRSPSSQRGQEHGQVTFTHEVDFVTGEEP